MVIVLLHYAHVIERRQNCVLNTASLSTGWICSAGLIMVGNFQVRAVGICTAYIAGTSIILSQCRECVNVWICFVVQSLLEAERRHLVKHFYCTGIQCVAVALLLCLYAWCLCLRHRQESAFISDVIEFKSCVSIRLGEVELQSLNEPCTNTGVRCALFKEVQP